MKDDDKHVDEVRLELSKSVGVTRGVKTDIRWWSHAARNGNKLLAISFLVFLSCLSVLGASLFIYLSQPEVKAGLCEYPSPQRILTSIKNVEGPAVEERGQITLRAIRCVEGKDLINVLTYRNFKNLDTGKTTPDLSGEEQPRLKGSITSDVIVQLPPTITSGVWRLEGFDQVPSTGELRTWFSESFLVVAK